LSLIEGVHRRLDVPVVLTGRTRARARCASTARHRRKWRPSSILRSSPLVGHVVVLRADPVVKESIDVWARCRALFV
jgi:hypothetical protein